jgi:hypothetical protein
MENEVYPDNRNTEKLDEFINFRLSKADRIKLEVVACGRSLGCTLRELIDEAYYGATEAAKEIAILRAKKYGHLDKY